MLETPKKEIKLFYCYAREDKDLREQFERHLSGMKRHYRLTNWHDREILPGTDWEQAIDEQLNSADIIFLLISPDFMASDYCYGKEMQRALERHEAGTCLVLPILLRPTHWESEPFGNLQLLPPDAKPVTRWVDRDEAFHEIVKEVSRAVKDLLNSLKTKKDWLDEGLSYRNLKRYDYALEAFEQAIRLDPIYAEAYQQKGKTLYELERYDSALEAFEQALHLNPNLVLLYIAKGQTLDALQRFEEALAAFEQAIHLDPNIADAYVGKDKALQQLGISRKAQEELVSQLQQTLQQKDKALEQLDTSKKEQKQLARQLQKTQQQLTEQQQLAAQLARQLEETLQQRDQAIRQLGIPNKELEELRNQLVKVQQQRATQHERLVHAETKLSEVASLEEQNNFDAILLMVGPNKINVIKVIRELTHLGLKDAKAIVDEPPKAIKEGISIKEAQEIVNQMAEVGATVTLARTIKFQTTSTN